MEKEEHEEAPYDGPRYESKTNFASIGIGPGSLSLLLCDGENEYEEGKVKNVDPLAWTSGMREDDMKGKSKKEGAKLHLPSITYKGHTIRPGDWVHLSNGVAGSAPAPTPSPVPSNSAEGGVAGNEAGNGVGPGSASRPIVAQVWEIWRVLDAKVSGIQGSNVNGDGEQDEAGVGGEEGTAQTYISALWFHRPSETYHSPQRVFWENEVFMGCECLSLCLSIWI